MSIVRNARERGSFIKTPGEYRVKVLETKQGLSKAGKKMLTVVFQTPDEQTIKGFFVQTLAFHMKALKELKLACGLTEAHRADALIGKECGILVEPQEPNAEGRVFMEITGYGKASEVGKSDEGPPSDFAPPDDNIPF